MSEHFGDMIGEVDDFLMGKSKVHRTLERLQDLADVAALVRANRLPADYAASLDVSVRDKFAELWQAAEGSQREL